MTESPFVFPIAAQRRAFEAGFMHRTIDTRKDDRATQAVMRSAWRDYKANELPMKTEDPTIENLEQAKRMTDMMQDAQLEEFDAVPDWLQAIRKAVRNELERQHSITNIHD